MKMRELYPFYLNDSYGKFQDKLYFRGEECNTPNPFHFVNYVNYNRTLVNISNYDVRYQGDQIRVITFQNLKI